ncbi:type II toxin-antitoxin system VapC family toxin [Natronobeatus ordinarius]|uniref:type II toxin-antitoxin system VapC family toxin n=1 Tax=Natronobeatus ordinarius TaxID=2963433 RepID=UPI0020CC236E|nr:PIN domain-containing protein [Natronobeatus ordinarius]
MTTTRFEPLQDGPTPLFLDTSGLFAYFHPRADEHEETKAFFDRIVTGSTPYRPLYTNTYVVDELVTLLQSKATPSIAWEAFERIVESGAIELVYENESRFDAVGDALERYDDHGISFTDHMIAVTMRELNVDHVLAYDGDFETLGLTVVPR